MTEKVTKLNDIPDFTVTDVASKLLDFVTHRNSAVIQNSSEDNNVFLKYRSKPTTVDKNVIIAPGGSYTLDIVLVTYAVYVICDTGKTAVISGYETENDFRV